MFDSTDLMLPHADYKNTTRANIKQSIALCWFYIPAIKHLHTATSVYDTVDTTYP